MTRESPDRVDVKHRSDPKRRQVAALQMNFRTLIFRSLRFHWRSHLGVLLGAAIRSAAPSEAASQGNVSQALASGTRAQRQLQEMRDELRKKNSSGLSEEMRQMRAKARPRISGRNCRT